jgi:hypothetical protein
VKKPEFNRRSALKGLVAISAAGALAACRNETDVNGGGLKKADLAFAEPGAFFNDAEMAFLSSLAQTLIPKTDTGGAVEAGVPAVLQDLASEWGDDAYRLYWRAGLRDLSENFQTESGQEFVKLSAAQQQNLLSKYDTKVFDGKIKNQYYRDFKRTVVEAYYKSEIGASEELAYEAVPGDWIGCVPLADFPKTWAT